MFDFESRGLEFIIIAALALIVIGPKDLPIAMRKLGQFIGRLRGMAAEFRASFDELARQSELDELRKEVDALRASRESVVASINPLADSHVADTFSEINQGLGQVSFAPLMSSQISAERAAAEADKAAEAQTAGVPAADPDAAPPVVQPAPKPKAPRKPRAKPATPPETDTTAPGSAS
jgi:sec-independent protein translocase protein TatB